MNDSQYKKGTLKRFGDSAVKSSHYIRGKHKSSVEKKIRSLLVCSISFFETLLKLQSLVELF